MPKMCVQCHSEPVDPEIAGIAMFRQVCTSCTIAVVMVRNEDFALLAPVMRQIHGLD